jgi:hypothetical protein
MQPKFPLLPEREAKSDEALRGNQGLSSIEGFMENDRQMLRKKLEILVRRVNRKPVSCSDSANQKIRI